MAFTTTGIPFTLQESSCPVGLEAFAKDLERVFFADVTLSISSETRPGPRLLTLGLRCHFRLTDILVQMNNGNWGGFGAPGKRNTESHPIKWALFQLREKNPFHLDIEELTIDLVDCSIVISRIHINSIADHLEKILRLLSENFIHFSRGLGELPYEIFIPVHEVDLETDMESPEHILSSPCRPKTYFEHWALYYDSDTSADPVILDIKEKYLVPGEFTLLYD